MGFPNEPRDGSTDLIPISTSYVPNVGFVAIQGSPTTNTDGSGNVSSPVDLNLKQIGDFVIAIGQQLKAASIPVALPSDQIVNTLDTNSASSNAHLGNIDTATSDLVADLDTLITNTAALATQATLASLLARHNDTFGINTAISAATTFGAIPLVSAIAANSSANLTNNGYQDTFIAQINVASAFVGTIGFYGLLPDGTTLQQINAHQRGTASNGNSSAINTGSALEQTWEGSIAAFKAVYVVCTAFTSGSASVQLGLTAADYAHAIINTVAQNLTQVGGNTLGVGNNAVPVLNVAATGYVAAYGSNPSALTANTNAAFKWGAGGTTQVNHIMLQNNTAINVNFDLDVATNAGSPILAPGQTIFLDVQVTAVNLQTNGTPNLNGSTAGNIIIRGWL